MGYIYVLTDPNGKSYVGQTTHDMKQRLDIHVQIAKSGSTVPISEAIQEYGLMAFNVAWTEVPDDMLDELEWRLIRQYNTLWPNGYNMETGGKKGFTFCEESKERMSTAARNRHQTEEGRRTLQKAIKASQTPEARAKLSKKLKGQKRSEEVKQKMKESARKRAFENRKKRPFTLIHPGFFAKEEKFDYIEDACEKYNLDRQRLLNVLNGKQDSHKKFMARFI